MDHKMTDSDVIRMVIKLDPNVTHLLVAHLLAIYEDAAH